MTTWYRVHAKQVVNGNQLGKEKIIAKFYIPTHAQRYIDQCKQDHPSWVCRISEKEER